MASSELKVVAVHSRHITNKHRFVGFGLIALVVYIFSNIVDEWWAADATPVAVFVVAIASIILLTGYSGQISLGHGALLAVGAYTTALTQIYFSPPVWICFVAAVLVTALVGAILGTAAARLSGPYLAGTTLAFAVGLPSIANQFSILGGEQGIYFDAGMPPLSFGESFSQYKWFL